VFQPPVLQGTEVAPEAVVAAFGVNLANGIEVATTIPLPTSLRGSSLLIRDSQGTDRPAPLFFVSSGQVNFLLPAGTAVGVATITANSADGQFSLGSINVGQRCARPLFGQRQWTRPGSSSCLSP
jgi:uncharacterized protein (TIGR03437 family)